MNIYPNVFHSALKYLKDTRVNIDNLIIMTGDFNIRDSLWDYSFPHYSSISNDLFILVDLFNLELLIPINPISTRYLDTSGMLDLVLDLMFLHSNSSKLNHYVIHPFWRLISDHAPFTITITIKEEYMMNTKLSLSKNSKQEEKFIKEVIYVFKSLDTTNLIDRELIEQIVDKLPTSIEQAWNSNTRRAKITNHSRIWWNEDCRQFLNTYRESRSLEHWKLFKSIVKTTQRAFFDSKIQEVTNKSHRPWKLMNWVNKCKLLAIEAIKYDN